MNTSFRVVVGLLLLGLSSSAARAADDVSAELARSRAQLRTLILHDHGEARLRDTNEAVPDRTQADAYAVVLRPDGSWADIRYDDPSRSAWQPSKHYNRMLALAITAEADNRDPVQKARLLDACHRAYAFWIAHDFQCPNWWYNQIGTPKAIGTLSIVLGPDLQPAEFNYATKVSLARYPIGMTGQNKVWLADNALMRALLLNDAAGVATAAQTAWSEVSVSPHEGIQADFSFHQHGPQQQFGNYGMAFAVETARFAQILRGTRWALPPQPLHVFRNYLLEGLNWVIWSGAMDVSACGRQLMPHTQRTKAANIAAIMDIARAFDPERAGDYEAFLRRNQPGATNDLVGLHYFWRSEYAVNRTAEVCVSLKMSSHRVVGAELVNRENLLGYHLPDGATYFYRTGDEYADIFPVWDWTKIPGVTCTTAEPPSYSQSKVDTDFAGAVSDGNVGCAALEYRRGEVSAHKAWFFDHDVVLCLGAGINAPDATHLTTDLEQCWLNGPVGFEPGRDGVTTSPSNGLPATYSHLTKTLTAPVTITHAGWRYEVLDPAEVHLAAAPRTGNWRRVFDNPATPTADVTRDVFTLWLDHGEHVRDARYAYRVSPATAVATRTRIVANEAAVQAAQLADGRWAVAFWHAGELVARGAPRVSASGGCVVLIGPDRIWVADPTERQHELTITIDGRATHARLPQGVEAGRTVEVRR